MGMFCGKRALGLACLAALVSAIIPAFARADVTGGGLSSVPPPAVPAIPSPVAPVTPPVSTPATPAISHPAPSTAAKIVGGSISADPAHSSVTITVPIAHATISPTSGSVKVDASKVVRPVQRPITNATTKAYTKVTGVKPVKKAVHAAQKAATKHGPRVLAGGNGGPDDPLSGCTSGGWTTCTVLPIESTPIDNRCWMYQNGVTSGVSDGTSNLPPQNVDYVYFTQGTAVLWTKVSTVMLHGMPALQYRVKEFVWGFVGKGTLDDSTYRLGHDFQDTWSMEIPLTGGFATRKLTQDMLKVNTGLAPDEVYTEHFIVDPNGQITISWHIVCHKGETGDDHQSGDHDRSGDQDKYKHNHDDYHGYNNDEPSSWDQDD